MLELHVEVERKKRLQFLWSAAHQYATVCPQIARFFMRKAAVFGGKGLPEGVRHCFCPRCGSLSTPHTSTMRVMGRGVLRKRRRRGGRHIAWIHKPLPGHRRYVLVHCRICQVSHIAAAYNPPWRGRRKRAAPTTPTSATPKLRKSEGRRYSSIPRCHLLRTSRLPQSRPSPNLRDFLLELTQPTTL